MIAYVMIGSNDIAKSRCFYDPLMKFLGATPKATASDERVAYVPAGGSPVFALTRPYNGDPASAGNGTMIALPVASRSLVEEAYALVLSLGAVDDGAPGVRSDGVNSFYSCYFRDTVGNKLCICHFG